LRINPDMRHEILAVVTVDEVGMLVAQAAASLALKSQCLLRLVAVFDESQMGDQTESATLATLQRLGLSIDSDVEVCCSIINGQYPTAVMELATAHQYVLMVIGAEKNDVHKYTPQLMAGVMAPTLVIPYTKEKVDFAKPGLLKILIADDLTDSSLVGIRCLKSLISRLQLPIDVLHLHIEPVEVKSLPLSPDYELTLWPHIAVCERALDKRCDDLKNQLRSRSEKILEVIDQCGGTYRAEIWHGDVGEELARAAEDHKSGMIVVGKHSVFHKHPWSFGQLDYKKMLGLNRPIMIGPEPS